MLVDVQETEPVMQEEIFGPILPIMTVGSLAEALAFIKSREKPLALYAFSNDRQVRRPAGVGGNPPLSGSPVSGLPHARGLGPHPEGPRPETLSEAGVRPRVSHHRAPAPSRW